MCYCVQLFARYKKKERERGIKKNLDVKRLFIDFRSFQNSVLRFLTFLFKMLSVVT